MSVARSGPNAGHFYSNIVSPIKIDCNFIIDSTNGNGLGIRSLKSNGFVQNVFMHTSSTPGKNNGYTNPNPALGYALIQFKQNYNYYLGGFSGFVSPTQGSPISISGSSVLTVGNPYIIATVGHPAAPHFTLQSVADVSGSLASKYFTLSDQFGNNYVVWFSVSGVGAAPSLTGSLNGYQAVQQSISTGDSANTIATGLRTTLGALNGSNSFVLTGSTNNIIVTGALTSVNFSPFPSVGTSGFTLSVAVTYTSLNQDWYNMGLPAGLTPAVGSSFIATATGSAVGTGTVVVPSVSGGCSLEVIGDPNASIQNSSIAANGGAWVMVQFLSPQIITLSGSTHTTTTVDTLTPANPILAGVKVGMEISGTGIPLGTTVAAVSSSAITLSAAATATASGVALTVGPAMAVEQPVNNSVVGMSFFFDQSSVTVDGL